MSATMAPMKDAVLYVVAMASQMHTTAENARSRYASVHLSVLPPMCVSCVKVGSVLQACICCSVVVCEGMDLLYA
jgi:hypothetical protein